MFTPPPCVPCHVSQVRCQVFVFCFLQSGRASRGRVCYQRGLPRLVSLTKELVNKKKRKKIIFLNQNLCVGIFKVLNRLGLAGAVLQTPVCHSFIHSFIHLVREIFPPNLQDIINH